jgi:hypothetical protein
MPVAFMASHPGCLNISVLGMIAYIIAGPDGTAMTLPRLSHAPAGA